MPLTEGELVFRFRELLHYELVTGDLYWRISTGSAKVGGKAGGMDKTSGYHRIRIDGKFYRTNRVIWAIQTGKMPLCLIDHRDRDKANNRWVNLREADYTQSVLNRELSVLSKFGRGVGKSGTKWRARMKVAGKMVHIGTFNTATEAAHAYQVSMQKRAGEFYVEV